MSRQASEKTLSDTLRAAIHKVEKKPSIYVLAKRTGVAPIVISRFLRGERDLRLATADKLAEALGLELRPKK